MYIKTNKNEIIISKNVFKIIFLTCFLYFFALYIIKIDFNGWVDITPLYFIKTVVIANLIVFISYNVFSICIKNYSFKIFTIISFLINLILFLLRIEEILFYYRDDLHLIFMLITVLRNIFSFLLSIIIFKYFSKRVLNVKGI